VLIDEAAKQDSIYGALDTMRHVQDRKRKGPELQAELQELFGLYEREEER